MSIMNVTPAKAKADLARRLAEDKRYQKWKESNQPLPTPAPAPTPTPAPAPAPAPATATAVQEEKRIYRREGRQIHVDIRDAPEFERMFGFIYGGLVEVVRLDGGDDFFFKGTYETRPE